MNIDKKLKSKLKNRYTYFPILIVGVLFVVSLYTMTANIKSHYFELMKNESQRLARSYSHNLEIAAEAIETANELMEKRIIGVGKIVYSMEGSYSGDDLADLLDYLEMDQIFVYNSEGIIEYSATNEYIGWMAEEDHPVHDFMISGEDIRFDPIRPDSETGLLFKYGYYRIQNGYFVQAGIKAEKVQQFLGSFDIQLLLEQMYADEHILKANFIDSNGEVIGSTDKNEIGRIIVRPEGNSNLSEGSKDSWLADYNGQNSLFVSAPVIVDKETIGSIRIVHSLEKTENAIDNIIIIGGLLLFAIAALIVGFNRSAYKNDRKLTNMAYKDSLTGLPNKAFLMSELTDLCSSQNHKNNALYLINISNFKAINMAFGYEFGDNVLKRVSDQLEKTFDGHNEVYRFASDRFVLLTRGYKSRNDLDLLSSKIIESIDKEIVAHGYTKTLNMNMAIVEIGGKYKDPDDIIRDATIALDFVGSGSYHVYVYFDDSMIEGLRREEQVEAEIVQAIISPSSDSLHLVYQPIYDSKTLKITGFEALARLNSPTLGSISPTEFIAIAEKRQLMVQLGNWIIDSALLFVKEVEREGFKDLRIAINISAAQLQDESFLSRLRNSIADTRISPSNVELEVTESIILENYKEINDRLGLLRDEGVVIAVDDFGTGYSSFSRLSELNIDTIKIDKSFIEKISYTEKDKLLIGDIISLSHRLSLSVVAEGVEDDIQAEYLKENHCDKLQGYLFSKPLSFTDALDLLKQNKTNQSQT